MPPHAQQKVGGGLGSTYFPLHVFSQFFFLLLHQEFGFLFLQMPPHAQQKVGGGLGSTYFPLHVFSQFFLLLLHHAFGFLFLHTPLNVQHGKALPVGALVGALVCASPC